MDAIKFDRCHWRMHTMKGLGIILNLGKITYVPNLTFQRVVFSLSLITATSTTCHSSVSRLKISRYDMEEKLRNISRFFL